VPASHDHLIIPLILMSELPKYRKYYTTWFAGGWIFCESPRALNLCPRSWFRREIHTHSTSERGRNKILPKILWSPKHIYHYMHHH
jgi:hypothetical protein